MAGVCRRMVLKGLCRAIKVEIYIYAAYMHIQLCTCTNKTWYVHVEKERYAEDIHIFNISYRGDLR